MILFPYHNNTTILLLIHFRQIGDGRCVENVDIFNAAALKRFYDGVRETKDARVLQDIETDGCMPKWAGKLFYMFILLPVLYEQ